MLNAITTKRFDGICLKLGKITYTISEKHNALYCYNSLILMELYHCINYMKALLIFIIISLLFGTANGQEVTPEMKRHYRENQIELDKNHGGIGIMLYRPGLGDLVNYDQSWVGINVLSDVLELKLGFGMVNVNGSIPFGFSSTQTIDTREFGAQFAVGANFPLPILTFGAQKSENRVFRGHPVLAIEFGAFRFHNFNSYVGDAQNSVWYFGVNPGYRVRVPFGSIEVNLNTRLGIRTGEEYYNGAGIYPSITFRIDAMKWRFSPDMVSVPASQTTVSNIESKTYRTGTRYRGDGSSVAYYTTYTTADVNVQQMNVGVQDIGPHFGIGPKISWMNPRRTAFAPRSFLAGIVAEARGGPIDGGITLEGGRIGHGSELDVKGGEPNDFRRKLDKKETYGQGSVNTVNLFANVGFDISPLFLIPFGITMDKGNATSFLSSSAGFIFGGHLTWNQQFEDPSSAAMYDQIIENDQGVNKPKFLDPREGGPGFLGGFYFSVQVGAMAFKLTNYRYYGAPLASNTLLSVAWRIPVSGGRY